MAAQQNFYRTERQLAAQQAQVSKIEKQLRERQKVGLSSGGTQRRLEEARSRVAALQGVRETNILSVGESAYNTQVSAEYNRRVENFKTNPKDYRSGGSSQVGRREYTPSVKYGGFSNPRSQTKSASVTTGLRSSPSSSPWKAVTRGNAKVVSSGGGGSSDANFTTLSGREIQVSPSGKEVLASQEGANFTDAKRGPVFVNPPVSGARSISPSESGGSGSLSGFEKRVEGQKKRQEGFERFVTVDKGRYENKVLRVLADKPDVQNIRSFASLVTGGVNLNPFSSNFGVQTNRESRSSVGRVTEDVVFGTFAAPIVIPAGVLSAGEKIGLTAEALVRPETRKNAIREAFITGETSGRRPANAFGLLPGDLGGRAGRVVERNEYSFLPGGTPINEAGASTLASAAVFGLLGPKVSSRGTVRTSGARGPIDVEVVSVQKGTTKGGRVSSPLRPQQTTTFSFTESVRGVQRFTRGKEAQTKVTIRPDGGVSRVTTVGRYRFEVEQAAGAKRAVTREYKDNNFVRGGVVRTKGGGLLPARITELARSEEARSVVQPRPDVIKQSRTGSRVLEIEQPLGKGKVLRGVLEEVSNARAESRAGPTKTVKTGVALETRPVVAERSVSYTNSELLPTRVYVADNLKVWGNFSPVISFQTARGSMLRWKSGGQIRISTEAVGKNYRASSRDYFRYRDTLAHEQGHAFAEFVIKDRDATTFFRKVASEKTQAEAARLQQARLVADKEFFKLYKRADRAAEGFAELYKARRLYPSMFKELAPRLDKAFEKAEARGNIRVLEPGSKTRIIEERKGLPSFEKTTLRISEKENFRDGESLFSSNEFKRGPLNIDEAGGVTRFSGVVAKSERLGDVRSMFEYRTVGRGQFFLERKESRISKALGGVQKRLGSLFEKQEAKRPGKKVEPRVEAELSVPNVVKKANPRSKTRYEAKSSNGAVSVMYEPRTLTRSTRSVEGIDVSFVKPESLGFASRGARSNVIFAPATQRQQGGGRQEFVPGVVPPSVVVRPDVVPVVRPDVVPGVTPDIVPALTSEPITSGRSSFFSGGGGGGFDIGAPDVNVGSPFLPVGALPFGGGGGGGFDFFGMKETKFKNRYSPSVAGSVFDVKGSKKSANIATITGLGVRPLRIRKRK